MSRRGKPGRAAVGGVLAALSAAVAAGPAAATAETLTEESMGGGLPPLTVRPSGFEDPEAEARARQERLLSRMQQNEFRFRAICTSCGAGAATPSAPFRPLETLGGSIPSASE